MLGSKSTYFHQSKEHIFESRKNVFLFLDLKGYVPNEIFVYIKAFDYFCKNPTQFDGATIVKDLQDIPHLDLDAMLHDYHYLNYGVGANFVTKWKSDWIYAKGNERKGKGQYSAFSRFIVLTIAGIGFVPYAFFKRGKISKQQKQDFQKEYKLLIK